MVQGQRAERHQVERVRQVRSQLQVQEMTLEMGTPRMLTVKNSVIDGRREQRFPVLEDAEIDRIRRFGESRAFAAGDVVVRVGESGHGMAVILAGALEVTQPAATGETRSIVTLPPAGSSASSRSCRDGRRWSTRTRRQPTSKRSSSRRARLRDSDGRRGRARRAHHARADPAPRRAARERRRRTGASSATRDTATCCGSRDFSRATVIRISVSTRTPMPARRRCSSDFRSTPAELPIVLCAERPAAAQSQRDRTRALPRPDRADRSGQRSTTSRSSAPGRPGWRPRSTRRPKACRSIVLDCRAFGGQAGASSRIENYLGFPTGISGMALMARAYNQAQKFGAEIAIPDEATRLRRSAARRIRLRSSARERRDA